MVTDEDYDEIKNWDFRDIDGLLNQLQNLWEYKSYFVMKGKKVIYLELHTGGFSDHEYAIQALKENYLFWSMYWEKSVRGGHHYFKIKRMRNKK